MPEPIHSCIQGLARSQNDLPTFSWDEKGVSNSGVPLLQIQFPDGVRDVAELNRVSSESCIFNGYLRNEPSSYVAMSGGCPFTSTFEIQFYSVHVPNGFAYKVENGIVSAIQSAFKRANVRDQHLIADDLVKKFNKIAERIAFPPNGFDINVKFYYDQLFKARFGANTAAKLDALATFVQGYYFMPSLTTKIHLIKTPHQEVPTSFTLGADEETL